MLHGSRDTIVLDSCISESGSTLFPCAGVEVNAKKVDCETCVLEADGFKFLNAGAGARVGTAGAGASATPLGAEAYAKTSGAEADACAGLIEDVLEAKARAVTGEARARAGVGLKDVGAHAG